MSTIEHFAIYAADTPKLKDFYVEAFGLKIVFESGGSPPAYFLADDRGMAIEIIGRPEGRSYDEVVQTGVNQRWVCHLAFWVDDFLGTRAALQQRGIAFETDTLVDTDLMKTAFFNDPEGNRLQIVWRKNRLGQ